MIRIRYQSWKFKERESFIRKILNTHSERISKRGAVIILKYLLQTFGEYSLSRIPLQYSKNSVSIGCLKTFFGCTQNWSFTMLAHVPSWFLSFDTTFQFYTFSFVIAVFFSVHTRIFWNLRLCQLSVPVSWTKRKHAETLFIISRIPFSSYFSTCSTLTFLFVSLCLPLSYRFNMIFAE